MLLTIWYSGKNRSKSSCVAMVVAGVAALPKVDDTPTTETSGELNSWI